MKMIGLVSLLLLVAPAQAATLTATWINNAGGTATTRIERRSGTDPYAGLVVVAPGVAVYADASVLAGTTYCYRLQAILDADVSPYSNEACVRWWAPSPC